MTIAKQSVHATMRGMFLGFAGVFFIGVAVVDASETPSADPTKPAYIEGEVLIIFKPKKNSNFSQINSVNALERKSPTENVQKQRLQSRFKNLQIDSRTFFGERADGGVATHSVQQTRNPDEGLIIGIAREAGKTTEELIRTLEKDPDISLVQPNYRYYPEEASVPTQNYEKASDLWNIFNNAQNAGVRADTVWKQGYTGKGVVVAVIDTGLEMTHPDLSDNIWMNHGETDCANNIDDDNNGFIDDCHGWDFGNNDNDPTPENPHGTHISGIVASKLNNMGTVGVSPDAKIMPIRIFTTEGTATTAKIVSAIDYAWKNGANIINMSLGTPRTTCPAIEAEVIKKAFDAGIFMVASSGNGGAGSPQAPALCQYVFAIGTTNEQKNVMDFSGSYLNVVDGVAPGDNIFSTSIGGQHSFLTGTSMAVPHVSGIAALMLSKKPDLTPSQIAETLCTSAEDLNEPGRDERSGCGFISAEKAVAAVPSRPLPPPENCHSITNSDSDIPTGNFAAPYSLFSSTNEVLMKVNCILRKAEIGSGSPNQFIFRKGYKADPTKKWQPINYNGDKPYTPAWLQGKATLELGHPLQQNISRPHYLLAYICTRVGDRWRCGCRDEICNQPLWNLQVYYPS